MTQHARDNEDGSYRILDKPAAQEWHIPKTYVPQLQWSPRTGISRYEWARRQTPSHQRPFFEALNAKVKLRPPVPLEPGSAAKLHVVQLETGLRGIAEDALKVVLDGMISEHIGGWRFSVMAEFWAKSVLDILIVSNADYRTLADWELIVRFRSWVLADDRMGMLVMPGQTPENLESYRNDRPNAIQIMSPRE